MDVYWFLYYDEDLYIEKIIILFFFIGSYIVNYVLCFIVKEANDVCKII